VGTFYFQTLLADYEYQVHQLVEQGQPVTAKTLDGIMENLFKAYYGDSMVLDDLLTTVWARISHFYRVPFYVYQYATCFASSAELYNQIIKGDPAAQKSGIDRYLTLLKSGGNDYPMNQLKKAGVDLTQPEPILAVINQFDELVTLLDQEIKKL
jgi:oligoendopeptidase F